jgi:hypothetical protein
MPAWKGSLLVAGINMRYPNPKKQFGRMRNRFQKDADASFEKWRQDENPSSVFLPRAGILGLPEKPRFSARDWVD